MNAKARDTTCHIQVKYPGIPRAKDGVRLKIIDSRLGACPHIPTSPGKICEGRLHLKSLWDVRPRHSGLNKDELLKR